MNVRSQTWVGNACLAASPLHYNQITKCERGTLISKQSNSSCCSSDIGLISGFHCSHFNHLLCQTRNGGGKQLKLYIEPCLVLAFVAIMYKFRPPKDAKGHSNQHTQITVSNQKNSVREERREINMRVMVFGISHCRVHDKDTKKKHERKSTCATSKRTRKEVWCDQQGSRCVWSILQTHFVQGRIKATNVPSDQYLSDCGGYPRPWGLWLYHCCCCPPMPPITLPCVPPW